MTADDLRALSAAATPGPWEDGDVWNWAGCGFNGNGPDQCVLCARMGEPVWTGKADINGKRMHAHKHRNPNPYGTGHRISGPSSTVAGNYDYEEGGIIDVEDLRLIVWLRNHADALADLIDFVRETAAEGRPLTAFDYEAFYACAVAGARAALAALDGDQ